MLAQFIADEGLKSTIEMHRPARTPSSRNAHADLKIGVLKKLIGYQILQLQNSHNIGTYNSTPSSVADHETIPFN